MKPADSQGVENFVDNLPLDDEHAHILMEFDQRVIPLRCLTETIEMAGATILEIITLSGEPEGNKSILVRLESQDVRNAVSNLARHPLIRLEGFNPKANLK